MKLIIVNPQNIATEFDNKKTEIKKYMDNLDFAPTKSSATNLLKRVALLMLNDEETNPLTIDYKNDKIEYKNNLEFLIAAKNLGKKEILMKVLSNEDKFMEVYQGQETDIVINTSSLGFINWQEKNNINQENWGDLEFLKDRMKISSFNDVMKELIKKDNKIYLSKEFIEKLITHSTQDTIDAYFSFLKPEELRSETIVEVFKEDFNKFLFSGYLCRAIIEENKKDKEIVNFIKTKILNASNIDEVINSQNIHKLSQYIPNNLRNGNYIYECVLRNLQSQDNIRDKLTLDQGIKILGKKYLTDKKNFILFISSIANQVFRTETSTDKVLEEITAQFNLQEDLDNKKFEFLYDNQRNDTEYSIGRRVIQYIIRNNMDKISDKEKINLFSKGLMKLEKEEISKLTHTEEDLEYLLHNKNKNRENIEIIKSKIKNEEDIRKFLTKKENIIAFISLSFNGNWLKNKIIPNEWKEDHQIIIQTYARNNYKDIPLDKRKELEESKENIKQIITLNHENFDVIRSENKYSLNILKELAIENSDDFVDLLGGIPDKKWFNFNFALKLIDYHPKSLQYIPDILFDNKQFTLNIFEKYETNNGYFMKDLLSKIPEELKSFFQDNNINSDFVASLTKHFTKDYLEVSLLDKNTTTKKLKI